jgi:hypothetical protein
MLTIGLRFRPANLLSDIDASVERSRGSPHAAILPQISYEARFREASWIRDRARESGGPSLVIRVHLIGSPTRLGRERAGCAIYREVYGPTNNRPAFETRP